MRKVKKVYAQGVYIKCPHCGSEQDGWLDRDIRGAEETCDDCEISSVSQSGAFSCCLIITGV